MTSSTPVGKFLKSGALAASLAASLFASGAAFAVSLPAVSACSFGPGNLLCYTTTTGAELYVASAHDDFISYGVNAINTYSDLGYTGMPDFTNGLGSGNILKLFTYNNSTNDTFPDANSGTPSGNAPSNSTFDGWWPTASTSFLIADLKGYLGTGTTPVFGFDLGEPQNGNYLLLNGYYRVVRPDGSTVDGMPSGQTLAEFSFDNVFNSAFDPTSLVTALTNQPIYWRDPNGCVGNGVTTVPNTTDLCTKTISNVFGSGSAEFYAYSPLFNINDYQDGDILQFFLNMDELDGTGEELFLVNGVTPPSQVPEPVSIALFGLSLLGLGAVRRRAR